MQARDGWGLWRVMCVCVHAALCLFMLALPLGCARSDLAAQGTDLAATCGDAVCQPYEQDWCPSDCHTDVCGDGEACDCGDGSCGTEVHAAGSVFVEGEDHVHEAVSPGGATVYVTYIVPRDYTPANEKFRVEEPVPFCATSMNSLSKKP